MNLRWEDFSRKKVLSRKKMLQDRGALPEEEGDVVREYRAMHEENFLSNWLRRKGKCRWAEKLKKERVQRGRTWRREKRTRTWLCFLERSGVLSDDDRDPVGCACCD